MQCSTAYLTFLGSVLLLSSAAPLRADYINGIVWSVPASTAGNAPTLGNTPGPDATELGTFTVDGIDFSGDAPGAYNLGGFLNSGGDLGSITYMNGADGSTDLDNTLWEFTGSAYFVNGESFNVEHDDGVNLYVNNTLVLGDPGPTSPILSTFTYSGPTGTESFDFIYAECCGGTADFQTTLVPVQPSPEPASMGLMIAGALMLGVAVVRRKRLARTRA